MFCGGNHFVETARIAAKMYSAKLSVRTGDVQLIRGNAFTFIENLDGVLIVFAGVSEDIGDDHDIFNLAQLGKLFVKKCAGANVLQANGIKHSGGGFIETRRRIADHGLTRESFDHEAAKLVQMHNVFELDAVGKGAAGGNDGILQFDSGKADLKIGSHAIAGLECSLGSMLRLSLHKQKVSPATIAKS